MPANVNDLLDWADQAGVTVDDPTKVDTALAEFKGGIVTLTFTFKPGAVTWPEGLKDCKIGWTRANGM